MIYVMSDLHGAYEKYKAMLQKINFNENDILYILGDVIDRGEDSLKILLDMMNYDNIYPILGNHELMALEVLPQLMKEVTNEHIDLYINDNFMQAYVDWTLNGGNKTLNEFKKLSSSERQAVLEYLEDFLPYDAIDVNDRTFLLVHAGLNNYQPGKKLHEYSLTELTFMRPDYEKQYFNDDSIYIVCGHTPTPLISGKAEIYHSHNNICIDCGATFKKGRLACLCLDTLEEFYV